MEGLGAETVGLSSNILYTRDVDGGNPIHVLPKGNFKLVTPNGEQVYSSARQLLIAVTGHPTARNWTLDRYFRRKKWDTTPESVRRAEGFLDWFRPVVQIADASITKGTAHHLAQQVITHGPQEVGIDLVGRSHEVAKLLFAGFGNWIYTAGYDPQEVLQEVYLGLAVRNQGKCPWTKSKSSFGHYVHMVCNGVLSNYHRKNKRIREHEQVGAYSYNAQGDFKEQDVASTQLPSPTTSEKSYLEERIVVQDLLAYIPNDPHTHLAKQILPYIKDGYTRTDIARKLGLPRMRITEALAVLQHWAGRWAARTSAC